MIRRLAFATCALVAVGAMSSACTPTVSFQGYQAIEAKPADVKVGAGWIGRDAPRNCGSWVAPRPFSGSSFLVLTFAG